MPSLNNNIDSFPLIGKNRIWTENFITSKSERLSSFKLSWEKIGKLSRIKETTASSAPCIYFFVRHSKIESILPMQGKYPLVVYVGRTNCLKRRISEYNNDYESVMNNTSHLKKVRDNIKVMFKEYEDNLDFYYSICKPDDLVSVENLLIQIFDPIFNEVDKLSRDDFSRYDAFRIKESLEIEEPINKDNKNSIQKLKNYILGDAKEAF